MDFKEELLWLLSLPFPAAVFDRGRKVIAENQAWTSLQKQHSQHLFFSALHPHGKAILHASFLELSLLLEGKKDSFACPLQFEATEQLLLNAAPLNTNEDHFLLTIHPSAVATASDTLFIQSKAQEILSEISAALNDPTVRYSNAAMDLLLGKLAQFINSDLAFVHVYEFGTVPKYKWKQENIKANDIRTISTQYHDLTSIIARTSPRNPTLRTNLEKVWNSIEDKRKRNALIKIQQWAVIPILKDGIECGNFQFFWLDRIPSIDEHQFVRFSILGDEVLSSMICPNAEDHLLPPAAKLQSLLTEIPDGLLEIDKEGNILYHNPNFPLNTEGPAAGTSIYEQLPENVHDVMRSTLIKANKSSKEHTLQLELKRDDQHVWYRIRIIPLNGKGRNRKHLLLSTDVTEHVETLDELLKREHLYRLLADNMQDMVSQHEADGNVVWVSQSVTTMLGYRPEELIGENYYELLHPDDANYLRNYAHQLPMNDRSGEHSRIEYRIRRRSKGYIWFESLTKPIFDADGRLLRLQIASRNITKRKEAEKALQTSKERQELALRGADLGLWDWNIRTGQYIFNKRWLEMLDYQEGDVEETLSGWASLVHPDDMNKINDALRLHLQGKAEIYEAEHRLLTKHRKWKWILSRGRVLEWDENGKALRAVGTHLDITENKKLEATIVNTIVETQERERIRFAKDLHDGVGQYLSAIRFNLNAIGGILKESDNAFLHELIGRSNDLLETTVNDLRSISHNIMPGALNDLGLMPAVDEMLGTIRRASDIEIEFDCEEEDRRYPSNVEIGIYRIVQELINNTLKHSGAKRIELSIREVEDNHLKVHYADNGIGLPERKSRSKIQGIGMKNMETRVKSLNGTLRIANRRGFTATAIIPLTVED